MVMVREFTIVKSSHNRVHKSSPTAQALTTNTVQSDASPPHPHTPTPPPPRKFPLFPLSVCVGGGGERMRERDHTCVYAHACIVQVDTHNLSSLLRVTEITDTEYAATLVSHWCRYLHSKLVLRATTRSPAAGLSLLSNKADIP